MPFATQVPTFASAVQRTPSTISFSLRSGTQLVAATILPDITGGRENNTNFDIRNSFNYRRDCVWRTTVQHGRHIQTVVSVRNPGQWTIRIQTTFAVESSTDSAYGRGTTAADESAGTTSLEFHESQHGALALSYVNTHALPVLNITAGMTRNEVLQELRRLNLEFRHFGSTLRMLQIHEVDCVGVPMNERECR